LDEIPGIGRRGAERIIAETGCNMEQFPSASQFCSWAGLVPQCNESAGKRKSSRTRKGNAFLKTIMVEAAMAAIRNKRSFWFARFSKIAPRRGGKKAVLAVARSMLVAIYHMLKKNEPFHDLGAEYYCSINADKIKNRNIKNLQALGFQVQLTPIA
jgi:transposase